MPPYSWDWWSWTHLAFFELLAFAAIATGGSKWRVVLLVFGVGLGWEVFEAAVVEPMMGFREPWYNRWLSDPIADLAGAVCGALAAALLPSRTAAESRQAPPILQSHRGQ